MKISKQASDLSLIFMLTFIVWVLDYSVCECDWLWSHNGESAFILLQNRNQLEARPTQIISRIIVFKYVFI